MLLARVLRGFPSPEVRYTRNVSVVTYIKCWDIRALPTCQPPLIDLRVKNKFVFFVIELSINKNGTLFYKKR